MAEHLVASGLARIVEWHAGMLASTGGMERLRAAEKSGKEKRLNLFANQPVTSSTVGASAIPLTSNGTAKDFEGTVIRIWSGDQVSVVGKDGKEHRLQLSSTRGPKYVYVLVFSPYLLSTELVKD